MQEKSQKLSQLFLTAVGLLLFFLALALNHYHPRNQGIANLTRGSFFKELGVQFSNDQLDFSSPIYVNPLSKGQPTPDKMADPTTSAAKDQSPSLPVVTQAKAADDETVKPKPGASQDGQKPAKEGNDQTKSQAQKNQS